MSKKYVIEIKPEYEDTTKGIMVLGARDSNLYVDTLAVDDLEELNSDYINEHFGQLQDEAYQKGLENGKQATFALVADASNAEYQKGLNDAWECARKLFSSMADSDIEKAFPTEWNNGGFHALINLQPQEAIEKLKAYEEKQKVDEEIKVGDEVEISQSDANGIWVVIKVEKHDGYEAYCAINKDGDIYFEEEQDRVTKTGRRFDIESILEDMRE